MTVIQTALVFVGIPVAVFLVVAGMVYGGSARAARRYRPGRDYDFAPVWFLARPEEVSVAGAADYVASGGEGDEPKALESGPSMTRTGVKGGASGNW
ncbi:MAG TPA: hypothetical protein VE172_07015 [Stackebrandtia sp.]|jgi:hypothetical protein|uniref:aa3-type cytochrome oxidase subunit CtaJ n=1 Tax=Stackebrandtia sp. TaxID=2023065 RepID=UPI002D35C26A|nr:hypothetical protein [Stackebrandtia sp.]HZE38550.1 hypothetical protein [Stackebrandtia sp.]